MQCPCEARPSAAGQIRSAPRHRPRHQPRIDPRIAPLEAPVEVRPGRAAAGARARDRLALADAIADLHVDLGQMQELAVEAHTVIDHRPPGSAARGRGRWAGRRSEEHTSELHALMRIPYPVFCLKKKKKRKKY